MQTLFLNNTGRIQSVYAPETIEKIKQHSDLYPTVLTKDDLTAHQAAVRDTEVIFSTWGMVPLSESELATYFPKLRAVLYAAGTVQGFARPFLSRGIAVSSASAANGIPVAELTVSQILLANKGFFGARVTGLAQRTDAAAHYRQFPGNYNTPVGILGAGMIGRRVIELLRPYVLQIYCFDPFLSADAAAELCVQKCTLSDVFASCQTVSNHLANNNETRRMLTYELFEKMPQNGTFINTGRGAQVVEDDLIRILKARPHFSAILDVTDPEPPLEDSPFYTLPNAYLTPHLAGSSGNEPFRMGEYAYAEFERLLRGEPLQYAVTPAMLATMA